jgi:N-carbamoyl-L-amino-acid hydrolase
MINFEFTIKGQTGHAGTTPMKYRKDALYAAVEVIRYLHDELDRLDEQLVYTTGKISAHPNSYTSIPDEVRFTLDARHQDPEIIRQVVEIIQRIPPDVKKCKVTYEQTLFRKTVQFTPALIDVIEQSANDYGYVSRRLYADRATTRSIPSNSSCSDDLRTER